jgi:radical SAM superfamily enzyme YgiQ (UPF0313 family)
MLDEHNTKRIREFIEEFDPKVLCFTAVTTQYPNIRRTAEYVRKHYPDIYLLAGGVHITLNPEDGIRGPFDAICVGEGEYPTLELIQKLEKGEKITGIKNLWIKQNSDIEKNYPRTFIENLDELPFPDREMWQEYIMFPNSTISVLLGRGCPFECTYCSNHILKTKAPGKYVRLRDPDMVIKEIKNVVERFPNVGSITFEVETMGVNLKWDMAFLSKLQEMNRQLKRPISFVTNLRIVPGMDYRPLFEEMKKTNFSLICIGLESGSEKIRKNILNRFEKNEDVINATKLAREYGIGVSIYSMIGLPDETFDDFKETVRVNRACNPDSIAPSIFYPYPGTRLYDICVEKGLIDSIKPVMFERRQAVLNLPGFSRNEIQRAYDLFPYYVYHEKKPTLKILVQMFPVLLVRLKSHLGFNQFYHDTMKYVHRTRMGKYIISKVSGAV